eukprot:11186934-Lingulodinium_polyedra.AAC.1
MVDGPFAGQELLQATFAVRLPRVEPLLALNAVHLVCVDGQRSGTREGNITKRARLPPGKLL